MNAMLPADAMAGAMEMMCYGFTVLVAVLSCCMTGLRG